MSNNNCLWGIDLGGTKIEICCFSLNSTNNLPDVHLRERIETKREEGYESILNKIKELCIASQNKLNLKITELGVGHPGTVDRRNNTFKNSNTICLNNKPVVSDLRKLLNTIGITKVLFENDANCFALAESKFGSSKLSNTSFGVIIGTGTGGGLINNKQIISGSDGIAGEWGHLSMWDNGPKCYCGKKGCLETLISGPALEKQYYLLTNNKKSLSEIILRSSTEIAAKQVVNKFIYWFGKALADVINIYDPDCIVLGGGLSNIEALYQKDQSHIAKWVFNNNYTTPVLKASLGDSAGVFGAGLLCTSQPL